MGKYLYGDIYLVYFRVILNVLDIIKKGLGGFFLKMFCIYYS